MSPRKLSYYGDEVLRRRSEPLEAAELGTAELRQLVDEMYETCEAEEGAGLAAPQIGIGKRLFVVDCQEFPEEPDDPRRRFAIVNPEVVAREGKIDSEEGCLSIPGVRLVVQRARRVTIRGLDIEGQPLEIAADGLVSRCIQHELDHLDGILIIDRVSSLKRQLLRRQLEEIAAS
jgi:peptide deformylase